MIPINRFGLPDLRSFEKLPIPKDSDMSFVKHTNRTVLDARARIDAARADSFLQASDEYLVHLRELLIDWAADIEASLAMRKGQYTPAVPARAEAQGRPAVVPCKTPGDLAATMSTADFDVLKSFLPDQPSYIEERYVLQLQFEGAVQYRAADERAEGPAFFITAFGREVLAARYRMEVGRGG